ncbi:hypothetical protein KJ980_02945 [Patescibacteria group bacterium]|nr:hypothetical protein [Patescibacteria group bacterium]MBU4016104.1 hypothetical protein [Patescibacteria group bacterium]MBU4098583.1 hypothetical protein [Patescibacteria group bacterium]
MTNKISIKTRLIKFINPLRRILHKIYSFILAAYLGKIIIVLNQIDHNILNMIFYFHVFNPTGDGIKEYYRVISTQTMGKKLYWLKKIYIGEVNIINKETKTSLKISESVMTLVGNEKIHKIINSLEKLIKDTRNPLVHSNYFLGYGNEYKWSLSYHRTIFDKEKNDFDHSPFTIKEVGRYLKEVQSEYDKLMKLYFKIILEILPS